MNKKYTMPKEQAESIIASLLAVNTADNVRTMKENPQLASLARETIARNRDAAIALGIDDLYSSKLAMHLPG